MERGLLWGIVVLGVLGWLVGFVLTRGSADVRRGRRIPLAVSAAIVALVAAAVITVPGRPLGTAGQWWGRGILLGGVASLLASWVLLGARQGTPRGIPALRHAARIAAPLFAGMVPVAATLLWPGAAGVDIVSGVAAGWFVVSLLMAAESGLNTEMLMSTGFVITLCATVALGHYRDAAGVSAARWTTSAAMLAAGVALLTLFGGAVSPGESRDNARGVGAGVLRLVLPALLLVGLAHIVAGSLLGQPRLTTAAATGLVMAMLAWWLAADPDPDTGRMWPLGGGPPVAHVLPIFLGLGGVVAAFYLLTGYGIGIMLLAAWLPAGLILLTRDTTDADARLVQVLIFGVLLLLYRVFTQRFQDDLSGATLVDHFALFSIIVGIALPALLSGMLGRPDLRSPGTAGPEQEMPALAGRLGRIAVVVLIAIAVPAAMLVLWGPRAAIGVLTGLALASVIYPGATAHAWMALLAALPMAQWTHQALRLALLTRDERMRLLLILAAVIAVLILVADLGARITARLRRRGGPPLVSGTREGARP